jgi:hypothetical protein
LSKDVILIIVFTDELVKILISQFLSVTLGPFLHFIWLGAYLETLLLQLDALTE